MIKYLFTNNNLLGSKIISGATKREYQKTKDCPSHAAICFMDRWIFHSNFANGVHIQSYYSFKKKNNIVASLRESECGLSRTECILFQDQLVRKAEGAKYDYMAVCYFAYRIILKWLFRLPIPDKNKWEVEDKWFCNEIFELKLGYDCSMKTPNDIMWALLEHDDFDSCEVFP